MKRFMVLVMCLVSPLLYANLLINPGFETGTTQGWIPRFGMGAIKAITNNPEPHSGSYCGRDYNRSYIWNGICQSQNMLNVTETGEIYNVSVWLRTNTTTPITLAVIMQYDLTDGGGYYDAIVTGQVDNSAWVLLEAEYTMPDIDSTTATWYIECPESATAEIYVDDAFFGKPVPEPATMALLSLGSLLALIRRRA